MSLEKPKYNERIFSIEEQLDIVDKYVNKNLSTVTIGKEYGVGHKVIAKVLNMYNISRTGASRRK